MEKKDLWRWHARKIKLQNSGVGFFFAERDIWLCSMGCNLGSEEDGKHWTFVRPIVIVRKFNNDIFWAIPFTSTIKSGVYYFPYDFGGRKSAAILSQMRLMDRRRLVRKLSIMDLAVFEIFKQKIRQLLK